MKRGGSWPVFLVLLLAVIVLAYVVVSPFITGILGAAVLAYMFYPLYRRFLRLASPNIAASIVTVLIVIVLVVPVVIIGTAATSEARFVYVRALQVLQTGQIIEGSCQEGVVCDTLNYVGDALSSDFTKAYITPGLGKATDFVVDKVTNAVAQLPALIVNLLIMIFTTFFLLRDGKRFVLFLKKLLPVSAKNQDHIVKRIEDVTYGVVYGSIVVGAAQGVLATIAFWLAGVASPVLWGLLVAILAFIPGVGAALVYVPITAYMILGGIATGSAGEVYAGLALLIFSVLVLSSIDTFLKPYIIGDRSGMHPVLVMIGALGGIAIFGLLGFLIGPLAIALLQSALSIYTQEKRYR